jgi:hypothetical protein
MSTIVKSRRLAPASAVVLGLLVVGMAVAGVPLDLRTHQQGALLADLTGLAFSVSGAVVGALLAARRPRNPIGWLLLAVFLLEAAPAGDYAVLDYRVYHGTLPLGWLAVAIVVDWPVWLLLMATLLWLFPDGQLPAGRLRAPAVVLAAAGVLLGLVSWASGIAAVAGRRVPVSASGDAVAVPTGIQEDIRHALAIMVFASLLAWLVVQVPGYRCSAGERRQQLKWLYNGVVIFVASILLPSSPQLLNDADALVAAILPVCIGVAVLRYRLYEIDRIVSRVISYAVVTALLAGVFAGLVLLATDVLPIKGPVSVAVATLVVAALFNPLRKRVQRVVDRRFNRARYNAETVVAAFTARLRETVDLDAVQRDLAGSVYDAFEPIHVSVWVAAKE